MEIELIRESYSRWGVDGMLSINGEKICDTVEHPRCHLEPGSYLLELQSHPFRHGDGPMKSRDKEIIVGTYVLPGLVTKSQEAYDKLYDRLKKAWQRGTTIQLRVR